MITMMCGVGLGAGDGVADRGGVAVGVGVAVGLGRGWAVTVEVGLSTLVGEVIGGVNERWVFR
ncbi:MAG: hypothetical protein ACYCS9_10865 [Candidatus Dormibacteria bacterium]|jgi:hypothetical protein